MLKSSLLHHGEIKSDDRPFSPEAAKQINRQAKAKYKSINNAIKYYDAFKTYLKSTHQTIIALAEEN